MLIGIDGKISLVGYRHKTMVVACVHQIFTDYDCRVIEIGCRDK